MAAKNIYERQLVFVHAGSCLLCGCAGPVLIYEDIPTKKSFNFWSVMYEDANYRPSLLLPPFLSNISSNGSILLFQKGRGNFLILNSIPMT